MDKELFQTALRVLQQINKRLPVSTEDSDKLRKAAPPAYAGLDLDTIAVEIVQQYLRHAKPEM